jgi:hypothetical protein
LNVYLNPWLNRGAWRFGPQRIKKWPLNLRVKLRFFETPVKPISCTMHPRLNHGFRCVQFEKYENATSFWLVVFS